MLSVLAVLGLILVPTTGRAQKKGEDIKLPEAVKKTFDARFPKAELQKLEVEEEDGVTVYDFEFKEGDTEKETDITADGTMLEYTIVIDARAVPPAAMKPIRAAAEGATMKRIEEIHISYQTKDGKVIKLPKTVMNYAVEMTKGDKSAEIVVDPDGKVLEEPKWSEEK